jgi:hypothetical protein
VGRTGLNQLDGATVTSTGSTTARSLEARFADTINIKDFGALGDCVYEYVDESGWVVTSGTDDTGAIQAAIDYAVSSKNLNIYLPAGQYLVTGELIWPYRIGGDDGTSTDNIRPSMFGAGGGGHGNITNYSTTIIHQPTSAINCITDMSGHLHLKDLAIRGNMDADDGTQAGVQVGRGFWGPDVDPEDGVPDKAGGGADALLMNVHIEGCKWGIRTKGNGSDRGDVISCSISKNETGVWLDELTNNWVFMACSIIGEQDGNPASQFCKWGVQVGTKGSGGRPTCCSFIGCNIERSPLGQMWIQEAAVLTISGCYFEGGRYGVDDTERDWYDAGSSIGTVLDPGGTVAPNTIKFAGTPDLSGISEGNHYLEIKDAEEERVLHSLITSVDVDNYSVDVEATVIAGAYDGMDAYTAKNWQSSRIILLSAENWEDVWDEETDTWVETNTTTISRNIIIQGCYFNALHSKNGDEDGWIIEYGAANRVRGLTLLNNTYGNSNHGFIKTSGSFLTSPAAYQIVALNNHDPAGEPPGLNFTDDTTSGLFSLRLNDSYDNDRGRCILWRPIFEDRIEIKGIGTPSDPPDGSGYLYLDGTDPAGTYNGNLMFKFDDEERYTVAVKTPWVYSITHATEVRGYDADYPITFTANPPTPSNSQTIADGDAPDAEEIGQFIANMEARVDMLADVLATLIHDIRDGEY